MPGQAHKDLKQKEHPDPAGRGHFERHEHPIHHAHGTHHGPHEHHRTPFLLKWLRKKRVAFALTLGILAYGIFLGREHLPFGFKRASTGPSVKADIQFPFDKGQGLVRIGVEDVVLGVGMITGSRLSDGTTQKGFSGDLSFEMSPYKPGIRIRMERIRLIERTPQGDGRVFEPTRIYDDAMQEGRTPGVSFLEQSGKFPFVWESGKKAYVYFVFKDLPDDLGEGDVIITYSGDFPTKKHTAYYEDRLSFQRKEYPR